MSITFENRVALVTGAGAGLGRCHALELARRGAKVVVNDFAGPDRPITAAHSVVQEITEAGGAAVACRANVASYEDVEAMVADTIARWGRIDVLINNAGILRDKSFGKMAMGDWRAVVDVHLHGAANCTRAVWQTMKDQGYGRVLMTTSSSGLYGNFGQSNYGAAKMGLVGLMNTLCIEGGRSDIRVNCLAPTAATAMTDGILDADLMAKLAPEKVTPAALFLVSEDAPNRTIMFAGAGAYGTVQVIETEGIRLAEEAQTPEQLAARFDELCDTRNAACFQAGTEHVHKVTGS